MDSTPRVSGPYLDSYVSRNVMVIGQVVQLRGDQAIVDADGNVTANLNRVRFFPGASVFIIKATCRKAPCCRHPPKLTTW